jgi:hypothetical protein
VRGKHAARLRVVEHDVGPGVDGYFFADHEGQIAAVAINPNLPEIIKEGCETQARGYNGPRPPKGGRKYLVEEEEAYDLDPNAVLAIRSVIEDLKPEWVEDVKEACRMFNHPRYISAWCDGLSIAVVVAIIENLKARGEIPSDGECGEVA